MATTTSSEKKVSENYDIQESKLKKLFEDQLKDIYWAEKTLTKALPKMAKNATSKELVTAITNHLKETETHVTKVEKIFESMGKKPVAKKCEAMAGLVQEAQEMMEETEEGAMRDAAIISASQKVEHYEIASYGTLRTFANILQLTEASVFLEEILVQEKNADQLLTKIAETSINLAAANEEE